MQFSAENRFEMSAGTKLAERPASHVGRSGSVTARARTITGALVVPAGSALSMRSRTTLENSSASTKMTDALATRSGAGGWPLRGRMVARPGNRRTCIDAVADGRITMPSRCQ